MKADLSRNTFNPQKHYDAVIQQQGRVAVDADWNEQAAIHEHRARAGASDVIGLCGGPIGGGGFALRPTDDKKDIQIGAGHYYVDGILCENGAEDPAITIGTEPDLPLPGGLPTSPGRYLAYLDVWQRHITALDDPTIREVALGGPDTCTRAKTVWQVKLFRVGDVTSSLNCLSDLPEWAKETAEGSGKLAARAQPPEEQETPCRLPSNAGYQGLENQLYRVEIQDAGILPSPAGDKPPTFKWSRDNGTVVTRIESLDPQAHTIKVAGLGPDNVLGFEQGQWVELIDDGRELRGEPGTLVQIKSRQANNTLELDPDVDLSGMDLSRRLVKVRRWDSAGALRVEVPASNHGWIGLEKGVEVKFNEGTYRTGDFWLIPARSATATVEWPQDDKPGRPRSVSAEGINHHYCRLALFDFDGTSWSKVSDCRHLFPAVTELTTLLYVGGDGQEGAPNESLTAQLLVRVSNGAVPVAGANVHFEPRGGGTLRDGANSGTVLNVLTSGPDGIAGCSWTLGEEGDQVVRATLLNGDGKPVPGQQIVFNATLETGVRITRVFLRGPGKDLFNDTRYSVEDLFGPGASPAQGNFVSSAGINVECSEAVAKESVTNVTGRPMEKPVCLLSLAQPVGMSEVTKLPPCGFAPFVVNAGVTLSDDSTTIQWRPIDCAAQRVRSMLAVWDPILVRLRVMGRFVWSQDDPRRFLDGAVFGFNRGSSNTDIRLPSGEGRNGSDLEMWFWLTSDDDAESLPEIRVGLTQRSVLFSNGPGDPNDPSHPVNAPVRDAQGQLLGQDFVAQVFVAPPLAPENLTEAGSPPAQFKTGPLAGFWQQAVVSLPVLPSLPPGSPLLLCVQVFRQGSGPAGPSGPRGRSNFLRVVFVDDSVPLPPPFLTGLRPFQLSES